MTWYLYQPAGRIKPMITVFIPVAAAFFDILRMPWERWFSQCEGVCSRFTLNSITHYIEIQVYICVFLSPIQGEFHFSELPHVTSSGCSLRTLIMSVNVMVILGFQWFL